MSNSTGPETIAQDQVGSITPLLKVDRSKAGIQIWHFSGVSEEPQSFCSALGGGWGDAAGKESCIKGALSEILLFRRKVTKLPQIGSHCQQTGT